MDIILICYCRYRKLETCHVLKDLLWTNPLRHAVARGGNGGRSRISFEIICYSSQLTQMQSYVISLGLYIYKSLYIPIFFPDTVLPNYVILFVVHEMMLPNIRIASVVGWLVNDELERIRKEEIVTYSRNYSSICLEKMRKPCKILGLLLPQLTFELRT